MAEPDELDVAARVAAINAEHRATCEEIEADCEAIVRAWDDPYTSLYRVYATTGQVLPPADEARAQRDKLVEEANERRRAALEALDLERRLLEEGPTESLGTREPIPVPMLVEAVRLSEGGASFRAIADATGLSKRKIGYVKDALRHRDVWLDESGRLGLPRDVRNTPEGIRLPKR